MRVAVATWLIGGSSALAAAASAGAPTSLLRATTIAYASLSIVGLCFSAFFSGSETAFLTANRAKFRRLAGQGNRSARAAVSIIANPERTQAFVLLGTNVANVVTVASSLALLSYVASGLTPEWRDGVNTLIMTPIILLFGEVLPKAIGRARPGAALLRVSPLLVVFDWAFRPVTYLLLGLSLIVMRLTGQKGEPQIVTREDLRQLAVMGESQGVIEEEHRRMIHGVLELHEQRVEQVMRPLAEIVSVPEHTPTTEFLDLVVEHGYSRVPVYSDRVDNIVGVVNILDVIYGADDAETIDPFVRRTLLFVPETKRVATLLTELRFRGDPMALVVDEYGGIVGLITMEDLVEEIVGEIRDERDEEERACQVDELTRTLECDGKIEVDALNEELEKLGIQIPDGDYETIAGFVTRRLDSIPQVSDVVETDELMAIVVAADERSVLRVKIIPKGSTEARTRLVT